MPLLQSIETECNRILTLIRIDQKSAFGLQYLRVQSFPLDGPWWFVGDIVDDAIYGTLQRVGNLG